MLTESLCLSQSKSTSLYAQYTQEYAFHLQDRWHRFLKGNKTALTYLGSTKHIVTQLPSAILQGLLKCVTEHLKSYISSHQALIRRVIQQSNLSPSDKHPLHSLNPFTPPPCPLKTLLPLT